MRIVLTGGTGFIGSKILSELNKKNFKILVLSRKKNKNKKKISFLKCDLFKPSSYIKKLKNFNPNVLIHCAWYEIPKLSKKNSYFQKISLKILVKCPQNKIYYIQRSK